MEYYPASYHGQSAWPKEHNIFATNGAEFAVNCFDMENVNASTAGIHYEVTCPSWLVNINGVCRLPCPSPIFNQNQYQSLDYGDIIPGWIGFIGTMVLVVDVLFRDRTNTTAKSLLHVRRYGSFLCIAYFLIGPLLATILGVKVKCGDRPSEGSYYGPELDKELVICAISRAQIYILIALNNLILWHQLRVFKVLKVTMHHKITSTRGMLTRFERGISIFLHGVPWVLCAVMYMSENRTEDLVSMIAVNAREGFSCVPRLTLVGEVMLVHVPLFLSVFLIVAVSMRNLRYLTRMENQVKQELQRTGSTDNLKINRSRVHRMFARRLVILGFGSAFIMFSYAVMVITTLPQIKNAALAAHDFFICQGSNILHVYDRMGTHKTCDEFAQYNGVVDANGAPDRARMSEKSTAEKILQHYSPSLSAIMIVFLLQGFLYCEFVYFNLYLRFESIKKDLKTLVKSSSVHPNKLNNKC